jgi:hypothetical protein
VKVPKRARAIHSQSTNRGLLAFSGPPRISLPGSRYGTESGCRLLPAGPGYGAGLQGDSRASAVIF